MGPVILFGVSLVALATFISTIAFLVGLIRIRADEVGIIIKRIGKRLPEGKLIALEGEAGIQAHILPPGWHFGYLPVQYRVRKVKATIIPPGEIGLVVAADGESIPESQILGRVVESQNFQDARQFLKNGGQKGRQLGILTAGTYRINTAVFTIITSRNAGKYGLEPHKLKVHQVQEEEVGLVTTLDGAPIDEGEIAGPIIQAHNSFQNAQIFLDNGGRRGLQEQVLLSGSWNLNPWFVQVSEVPMTEIPIGHVGIVISFVGKEHVDVSGDGFKHGNLVDPGHKGVWVTPLYPGKHPINTRIMKVELVPTTNIVLNWAGRTESHSYDKNLAPITVRSYDGFGFNLDVAQIIHIGAPEAPKVISRVGSVQNLVDHVLEPIVGNYFRNSAQQYTVLDFLNARSDRQEEASQHIRMAIGQYDVQAIDTLIGDIHPPEDLMETQTQRKIAEEQRRTYDMQREAQEKRQLLVRETALAEIQQEVVQSEQGVRIAELKSHAAIKHATGESEAIKLRAQGEAAGIRERGQAQAEAYKAGVESLGIDAYRAVEMMKIIGESNVDITPEVLVTADQTTGGLSHGLLGMLLKQQIDA